MRAAANDEQVIEECARQCRLSLPGPVGPDGKLVRGNSDGGPVGITRTAAEHFYDLQKHSGWQLERWDLRAVELTTAPDFATVAKPHGFAPPGNFISDPETETAWWCETLRGLVDIVSSVQQVQFTRAPNVESWERLPLLIWARPVCAQDSQAGPGARRMFRI